MAKLQSFASDDLGSFYLDILKDRLYTTATTGLARRSAQTALWYITAAYLRLMAPILSFTAEEAFAIFEPGKSVSIFTEEFFNLPEIAGAEELLAKWERIRKVRTDVQKEIENLRTEGKVGSSLQAEVDITVEGDAYDMLSIFYRVRQLPFYNMQVGDIFSKPIFSGRNIEQLDIEYMGTDTVEVMEKPCAAYYLRFWFYDREGKRTSDKISAWLSVDDYIPLQLEGKLPVGSMKVILVSRE